METYQSSRTQSWLSWFLKGVLLLGMLLLFGRLAELQVIKGEYYRNMAEGNRVRKIPILAQRGKIYARGGEVLADNREIYKTIAFDEELGLVKKEASEETADSEKIVEWERKYPHGEALSHILGYIGEVNEEEVGKVDSECTEKGVRILGSSVGRAGFEKYHDCELRGVAGEELIEVDTFGQKLRTLGRRDPVAGEDIKTTIDLSLQKKLVEAMEGKVGASVITNARGQVLAMVSSPTFDPYSIGEYVDDASLPLFNRAVGGTYHPGSIFKMITATAALSEAAIDEDYTYEDTGSITVNEFTFNNWFYTQYGGTEGVIDLERALARSTDTFFYEVGGRLGIDKLASWAEKFGLGQRTGVDLPGEAAGLVPTPEWKKAVIGERWFLGNTYHVSIGQGDLLVTPLSANRTIEPFANGGQLCRPYLKRDLGDECQDLGISRKVLDEVVKGMKAACRTGGTAYPFFDFSIKSGQGGEIDVACKTGTAETNEEDKTHAWFVVFGPTSDPQYVMTVLIEKGGEGSSEAAPVAREMFDYIFNP